MDIDNGAAEREKDISDQNTEPNAATKNMKINQSRKMDMCRLMMGDDGPTNCFITHHKTCSVHRNRKQYLPYCKLQKLASNFSSKGDDEKTSI
jgi:hypothetical protein